MALHLILTQGHVSRDSGRSLTGRMASGPLHHFVARELSLRDTLRRGRRKATVFGSDRRLYLGS